MSTTPQTLTIRHRYTEAVLFEHTCNENTLAKTVAAALAADANLAGANLSDANLFGADLSDANLAGANLSGAKNDLWAIVIHTPHEIDGLRAALVEGRVNGSVYEGECACLVGTLANLRHCEYHDLPGIRPNSSRPAERLFMAIEPGMTPANNPIVALVVEWLDELNAALASWKVSA